MKKWSKRNKEKGKRRESKGQVFSLVEKRSAGDWRWGWWRRRGWREEQNRITERDHFSQDTHRSQRSRVSPEHLRPSSTKLIHHQLLTTTLYACTLYSTALSLKHHLHKHTDYSGNQTRIPLLQNTLWKCHVWENWFGEERPSSAKLLRRSRIHVFIYHRVRACVCAVNLAITRAM